MNLKGRRKEKSERENAGNARYCIIDPGHEHIIIAVYTGTVSGSPGVSCSCS